MHHFMVDAAPQELHGLRAAVAAVLDEHGVEGTLRTDTLIVVSELASNAIQASADGQIAVSVATGDGVVISVSNSGCWTADHGECALPEPTRTSGRGLAITKSMSDHMAISSTSGRTIVVVHLRSPPETTPT